VAIISKTVGIVNSLHYSGVNAFTNAWQQLSRSVDTQQQMIDRAKYDVLLFSDLARTLSKAHIEGEGATEVTS
jgi:hypothetical protein